METVIILSLDLGRYNSVACWYDPGTRVAEFRSIQTTPEGVPFVLTREPVSSVVFEACSQAGWVHDLCEVAGSRHRGTLRTGEPQQSCQALRAFSWHERVGGRTCSGSVESTPSKAVGRAW